MWALCLLVVHPTTAFEHLSASKDLQPLLELKEKFDEASCGGGRVQLNSIPASLKQTLQTGPKDAVSELLRDLKTKSYMVDPAQ
jgi:hypothetical protein